MDNERIRQGLANVVNIVEAAIRTDVPPSVDAQVALARFGIELLANVLCNLNDIAHVAVARYERDG